MDSITVVLVLLALAAGAAIGWFARSGRAARAEAANSHAVETVRAQAEHRVVEATSALRAELSRVEGEASSLRDTVARQDAQRRENIERERTERAESAARIQRESAVLQALTPVQETLTRMQQRVGAMEKERQEQFGQVAEQLRAAHRSDEQLRDTTQSLASALRSTTARGAWGEAQLRRIVEEAGLLQRVDFDLQAQVSSDAGVGRPDMVVRLPGGKAIAVDAKAPLESFLDASAIPDTSTGDAGARRAGLMAKHVKAVRAHVDALAKKAYWTGLDQSPEFVVCFIPSESVLAAALSEDPALLEHAFSRRVALASPVNLWAVLKTVAYSWTQQEVSDEARTLFELGNELYERLGTLSGHADGMRRAIERTVDSYNKLVGSLEGRVLSTARKFPGIDASKLAQSPELETIDEPVRRLTAPELLEQADSDAPDANADREADEPESVATEGS
ncbi:DNA recombination protein RmuC [Microbacterium halotolerans]|uniref:DNA recombination protein RmuC n=1 Tax=Microbacterium halotolerans TaxID=246613 RepID=UPI000E6AD49E|nr:DNA recombination protein RmuC [Microbacterium halotolerans]